jgi:hypothetical protein
MREIFPAKCRRSSSYPHPRRGKDARRDDVIRRMLKTPLKPHDEMKVGRKSTGKRKSKQGKLGSAT